VNARAWVFGNVGLVALLLAGCARETGAPPIGFGAPCATCGMAIQDRRFACERVGRTGVRQYDSIECLLRAGRPVEGEAIYVSDYDQGAVRPADSLWVVHGEFPSPMSGGLAAFGSRSSAGEVARETRGRVGRLMEFASAVGKAP
jgi:nitrous oxide reductase accessory protein NosL